MNNLKKIILFILILFISIITFIFYNDVHKTDRLVFNNPSDEPDSMFFFPNTEYLIEIDGFKQRQFQCNIWLKSLSFEYLDEEKACYDSAKFESLLLRSYITDATSYYSYQLDWISIFLENIEKNYCYKIPPYIERISSKNITWTPNIETSIYYPFDSYKFHLNLEEQSTYTSVVTNISPEKVTIVCKLNNFCIVKKGINEFILKRLWTFKLITIIFILLIIFYTIYLWISKSTINILTQSIGLFVGVWSIRTIICTNAPVFPTVIDYFTLVIFITLGTLLIYKSIEK